MSSFLDLFGELIKQSREGHADGPLEHYRMQGKLKKHEDLIPGGLADNKPDKLYDKKQIRKGVKVELEHVDDARRAKEIAKDHLEEQRAAGEVQTYYDKLQKMEGAKHANALVKAAVGLVRANRLEASAMKNPSPQVAQAATKAQNQVYQKRRNIRGIEPGAAQRARVSNDPNHPMHGAPTPAPMSTNQLMEIQRKNKEREMYAATPPAEYMQTPSGRLHATAISKVAALANKYAEAVNSGYQHGQYLYESGPWMTDLTKRFSENSAKKNLPKGVTEQSVRKGLRAQAKYDLRDLYHFGHDSQFFHEFDMHKRYTNDEALLKQHALAALKSYGLSPGKVKQRSGDLAKISEDEGDKHAELSAQPEAGKPMPSLAKEKGQDQSASGQFRTTSNNTSGLTIANADLMLRSKENVDARISELQQLMADDPETGAPGELMPEEEEELRRLSNMSDGLNKLLRKRLFNIDEDLDHGQMEAVKDLLMAGSEGSYAADGEPWTPELVEKAAFEIKWKNSGLGDKRKPPEKGRMREQEEERVEQTTKYREAKKIPHQTHHPRDGAGSVGARYSEGNGTIDEPTQVIPNKLGSTRARAEVIVYTPKGVYALRRGKHWLAFPGGGIEDGEDPADAARREVVEEADLNLKSLKAMGTNTVEIPEAMRGKGKAGRNHSRSENHVFVAESAGKLKTHHKDRERFHVYDFDRAIEILTAALDDSEAEAFKSMNKKRISAVQQAKTLANAS